MKQIASLALLGTLVASACATASAPGARDSVTKNEMLASANTGEPVRGQRVDYDPAKDPITCEEWRDPLSRLKSYTVCLHKSEWDEIGDKHQRDFKDYLLGVQWNRN